MRNSPPKSVSGKFAASMIVSLITPTGFGSSIWQVKSSSLVRIVILLGYTSWVLMASVTTDLIIPWRPGRSRKLAAPWRSKSRPGAWRNMTSTEPTRGRTSTRCRTHRTLPLNLTSDMPADIFMRDIESLEMFNVKICLDKWIWIYHNTPEVAFIEYIQIHNNSVFIN